MGFATMLDGSLDPSPMTPTTSFGVTRSNKVIIDLRNKLTTR